VKSYKFSAKFYDEKILKSVNSWRSYETEYSCNFSTRTWPLTLTSSPPRRSSLILCRGFTCNFHVQLLHAIIARKTTALAVTVNKRTKFAVKQNEENVCGLEIAVMQSLWFQCEIAEYRENTGKNSRT